MRALLWTPARQQESASELTARAFHFFSPKTYFPLVVSTTGKASGLRLAPPFQFHFVLGANHMPPALPCQDFRFDLSKLFINVPFVTSLEVSPFSFLLSSFLCRR